MRRVLRVKHKIFEGYFWKTTKYPKISTNNLVDSNLFFFIACSFFHFIISKVAYFIKHPLILVLQKNGMHYSKLISINNEIRYNSSILIKRITTRKTPRSSNYTNSIPEKQNPLNNPPKLQKKSLRKR